MIIKLNPIRKLDQDIDEEEKRSLFPPFKSPVFLMDQSAVLSIPFQTPFSFQGPLGLPGGLVYCPPMMTAATKPQIASDQSDLPDEGNRLVSSASVHK